MMMSTRNYKLLFIFTFLPFLLFAQKGKIQAIVIDAETNEPIIGASASLLQQADKKYILGVQSDVNGNLTFSEVNAGNYALRISYVGKQDLIRENIQVTTEPLNLGRILLTNDGKVIQEVVVEGKLPDMQLGIDKKIFDVSQSLVSIGGTATDVLQNVPTIQVDQDGGVSLRGSTAVRILIDGKESAMAGSDINSLLDALPANSIAKVEVITNPSSKYDAEGQSGIINIVLKKDARIGLNGNATVSGGSFHNYNAGVNLNFREGKWNYFGGYNFTRREQPGYSYDDNTQLFNGVARDTSERTISDADNNRKGTSHTVRLGTDFYASEKTTFSLGSNISIRDNDRRSEIDYLYYNIPDLGSNSFRTSQQYEDDLGFDITFDFKQDLTREGENIMANVTYGHDSEDGTNDFVQTYGNGNPDFLRNNITSEAGTNWNLQLDYTLPFSDNHKLEAGYRSIIRNTDESQWSDVFDPASQQFQPDYAISNDFILRNGVHALYINYQRMLTEKLGAQVGLRGEQTYLTSTYFDLDPDAPVNERETRNTQDFFRLYPTAFLTYEVGKVGDKVQLSYSRRVQRPRGWQVNPFINVSDEINYRQGNPNLLPEDIHSFELSFAKFYDKWNFISSAYFRHVNDMVNPLLRDPSEIADIVGNNSNVTYSVWENVGKQSAAGFELISKVNIFKWWDATANLNVFYDNTTPYAEFAGEADEVENFSWNGNINTNVKFTKSTTMQIRGDYRAQQRSVQGVMRAMSGVDVALRQDVLKGKGSIMFNVRDLFNTRVFRMDRELATNLIISERRRMPRTFMLTFAYRFGIQDLNKKSEQPENGEMGDDMGGGF